VGRLWDISHTGWKGRTVWPSTGDGNGRRPRGGSVSFREPQRPQHRAALPLRGSSPPAQGPRDFKRQRALALLSPDTNANCGPPTSHAPRMRRTGRTLPRIRNAKRQAQPFRSGRLEATIARLRGPGWRHPRWEAALLPGRGRPALGQECGNLRQGVITMKKLTTLATALLWTACAKALDAVPPLWSAPTPTAA
jgi:hypothetical protein